MWALLSSLSWPELRHHPLRHAVAGLAIALGVALAFSVHLINASALSEFSAAVRSINGQPDLELRAQREGFDEALYARVAAHPLVAAASPVIELETYALDAKGERVALRVLGLDAFSAGAMSPALVPRPDDDAPRLALLDPQALFLNPAARARLGELRSLRLQAGTALITLDVRGQVNAEGPPLAVIDIAGAQQHFGWLGRLSRLDLRLVPGADRTQLLAALELPPGVRASTPDDAAVRVSNLSRAYRVNLTVLALVALFTGGFLVFSVLALSVAQHLALNQYSRRKLIKERDDLIEKLKADQIPEHQHEETWGYIHEIDMQIKAFDSIEVEIYNDDNLSDLDNFSEVEDANSDEVDDYQRTSYKVILPDDTVITVKLPRGSNVKPE